MICMQSDCEKPATMRLEVEQLRVIRRLAGFDNDGIGTLRLYLCGEHFRRECRDWVQLWDRSHPAEARS